MEHLELLGTSHISQESVKEITTKIESGRYDIIAVELDKGRAHALLSEQQNKIGLSAIFKIGLKGYIFVKIGQFVQQKLGKLVGVAPGCDMKIAMQLAAQKKLQIALIDQPIQITLKNFSKELTWRERFRFVGEIFRGFFSQKKQMKLLGIEKFDLRKVPASEIIDKMVASLRGRYPSVYKTLIEDRNKYMVKRLVKILRKYPEKRVLGVVGAGHLQGMKELLLKVDVVR
ncbi:hypothetical protein CL620_06445 [archaeon]|nr:hypothetical protein [archaeon]